MGLEIGNASLLHSHRFVHLPNHFYLFGTVYPIELKFGVTLV